MLLLVYIPNEKNWQHFCDNVDFIFSMNVFKMPISFPLPKNHFSLDFDLVYVNQSHTNPFFISDTLFFQHQQCIVVNMLIVCLCRSFSTSFVLNCWQHQQNWWNCLKNQLKLCSKKFSQLLLRTIGSNIEIWMSSIVPLCCEIETTFSLWIRHLIRVCVFGVLVFVCLQRKKNKFIWILLSVSLIQLNKISHLNICARFMSVCFVRRGFYCRSHVRQVYETIYLDSFHETYFAIGKWHII